MIVGTLLSASVEAAPEKVWVLRYAATSPEDHPLVIALKTFFMDRVEQETGGRVKFKFFPRNTLAKGPDIPDALVAGTAGFGDLKYAPLPMQFFCQLPGCFADHEGALASKAFHMTLKTEAFEQAWAKLGVKVLVSQVTGNYQLATAKKKVRTLADMEGVKVRVSGTLIPKSLRLLGAVPVSMPFGECYEALSKGVIDGHSLPIVSYRPYPTFEVTPYFTIGFSLGTYPIAYGTGLNTWKSFPLDIQEIIMRVGDEASWQMGEQYASLTAKEVEEWKKLGKTVFTLTPEDQKTAAAKVKGVKEWWVTEMEKKGYPGREVIDYWLAAMNKLRR
jgi:TRAP-type C4-dicarboxylate transport system substrate-binding protein